MSVHAGVTCKGPFSVNRAARSISRFGETNAGAPSSAAPMVSMGTTAQWAARDCIQASRQASGPDF